MSKKVVIVSQHFPPDSSTTAAIMFTIAESLASEHEVLVLSGTPGSRSKNAKPSAKALVIEIRNRISPKAVLISRALQEALFSLRAFAALLTALRPGDIALTVTAPFMLPYAVAAAAKLKRSRSILIMHDLYPDVLVMAGLAKPRSMLARTISAANSLLFRALSAIVTIGRDTENLLLRYKELSRDKIHFIPNWTTLVPFVRPMRSDNPYRREHHGCFIVGLSGNLGFTHDPGIVFEAAEQLRQQQNIHFLLSGWGVGYENLMRLQSESKLPNITMVGRVEDERLEEFLSAADVWLIPYRKNGAGVSVPSRLYNLLAVGRPIILVAEQEAEAALMIAENNLGWVIGPGDRDHLIEAIYAASNTADPSMSERAVAISRNFSREQAMRRYTHLINEFLGASTRETLS
jgi:colanic acid biosynthesis glycosyl transferase WcaI